MNLRMTYRCGLTEIKHTRRSLNKAFQSCSLLESVWYTSKSLLIMNAWWWRVCSSQVKFWSPELDADMVSKQGKQVGRQLWAGSYSAAEFHWKLPVSRILGSHGYYLQCTHWRCPKWTCETLSTVHKATLWNLIGTLSFYFGSQATPMLCKGYL
jgi:hypothetical protein